MPAKSRSKKPAEQEPVRRIGGECIVSGNISARPQPAKQWTPGKSPTPRRKLIIVLKDGDYPF